MTSTQALIIRTPRSDALIERPAEDVPVHEPDGGLSATQIITILRFYWKVTLVVALVIIVASAVAIKLMPKSYTATATLLIDPGKKDPLASQDLPDIGLPAYVATQMELIMSPGILLKVVDRLNLTADPLFIRGYGSGDKAGLREYASKNLAAALFVELGKGGQLLSINASSQFANRAADIANAVADVFVEEEHRRSNAPAGERARRYSEEVAELRAKVAIAQDNLAAFRQRKGITSVGNENGEGNTETQALEDLERHLLEAQGVRRALEAKSVGQQSTADEALASSTVQTLKTQLATQQAQLAQMSVTEGQNHPKVVALKQQMALTQRQLNAELSTLTQNTSTELTRARDLERQYAQAVTDQRAKVLKMREVQGEGAKLTLELESAQSVYKRALDGLDQVMFASANNNAFTTIINRATPPFRAIKPKKPQLLLFAIFGGIAVGLTGPLVYALLFDRRLRCRDDLERAFGIPVLAEFDALPDPSTA